MKFSIRSIFFPQVKLRQLQIDKLLYRAQSFSDQADLMAKNIGSSGTEEKKKADQLLGQSKEILKKAEELMMLNEAEFNVPTTPTDDQNRLIIASIIIAAAVAILAIGSGNLSTIIGKHFYTTYLVNALVFVPTLSAIWGFIYVLALASKLKSYDRNYLGYIGLPRIHMGVFRLNAFNIMVDIFAFNLSLGVISADSVLSNYLFKNNKILAILSFTGLLIFFILLVGFYNTYSINATEQVEKTGKQSIAKKASNNKNR